MPELAIDLRSNTKCGVANDPSPGMGLFLDQGQLWVGPWQWHLPLDGSGYWGAPLSVALGYDNLGSDPLARMRLAARNALADRMGLHRALLPDSNLAEILAHWILGTLADPTGVNRVKPLRMGRQGLTLRLGPFGEVVSEPLSTNHPNFDATLAVRYADYRRNRAIPDTLAGEAKDRWIQTFRTREERLSGIAMTEAEARSRWQEVLQKWTGHDGLSLFGRMPTGADLDRLLPPEFVGDGARQPATTIVESFNTADSDILGPDLPWTELTGDTDIVTNAAQTAATAAGTAASRADTALSSDNHRSQAVLVDSDENGHRGVIARKDNTATLTYYHADCLVSAGTDSWRSLRRVEGTFTAIGSDTALDMVDGDTIKLAVSDSTITRYRNGISQDVATDLNITGKLYTGISGGSVGVRIDDFEAADLAAGAFDLDRVERYYGRGYGRGYARSMG